MFRDRSDVNAGIQILLYTVRPKKVISGLIFTVSLSLIRVRNRRHSPGPSSFSVIAKAVHAPLTLLQEYLRLLRKSESGVKGIREESLDHFPLLLGRARKIQERLQTESDASRPLRDAPLPAKILQARARHVQELRSLRKLMKRGDVPHFSRRHVV